MEKIKEMKGRQEIRIPTMDSLKLSLTGLGLRINGILIIHKTLMIRKLPLSMMRRFYVSDQWFKQSIKKLEAYELLTIYEGLFFIPTPKLLKTLHIDPKIYFDRHTIILLEGVL